MQTEFSPSVETIEKFIDNLPDQLAGFPGLILAQIENLFGYRQMMFFPVKNLNMQILGKTGADVYSNFVTLNMSHAAITAYRTNIRHVDIFHPKSLPDQLKDAHVVFTSDIMSKDAYINTRHYESMHELHLEQQACINIRGKIGEILAKIVVFRSESEPSFTEADRRTMTLIAKMVGARYRVLQNASDEYMLFRSFNLIYASGNIGAIIVNHRLTVTQANQSALKLAESFLDEFRNEHTYILKNHRQTVARYRTVQEMVDWIGLDIISKNVKEYDSFSVRYRFLSSSFSFIDGNGDVEISHFISFHHTPRQLPVEFKKAYETLTPREQSLLRQIVSGSTNEEIAEQNGISIYTVRTHISNIYQKFDVKSRHALLLKCRQSE